MISLFKRIHPSIKQLGDGLTYDRLSGQEGEVSKKGERFYFKVFLNSGANLVKYFYRVEGYELEITIKEFQGKFDSVCKVSLTRLITGMEFVKLRREVSLTNKEERFLKKKIARIFEDRLTRSLVEDRKDFEAKGWTFMIGDPPPTPPYKPAKSE